HASGYRDWSSDVCSSDLDREKRVVSERRHAVLAADTWITKCGRDCGDVRLADEARDQRAVDLEAVRDREDRERGLLGAHVTRRRSEERRVGEGWRTWVGW